VRLPGSASLQGPAASSRAVGGREVLLPVSRDIGSTRTMNTESEEC
jgi:hypothetical protein